MKTTVSIRRLTLTALFAAIVCVMTWVVHIPVGVGGYVHFGDAFIYLTAAFLPMPHAMAAAAVGAAFADLLSGYPQYIFFTAVIKALMAMCFTSRKEKILCARNAVASVGAGVICIVGYYLVDVLLYGSFVAPLASLMTGSLVQSGAALVLFWICGAVLDRVRLKDRLGRLT